MASSATNILLDVAQLAGVLAAAGSVAMMFVWLWNVFLMRLVADAKQEEQETFLQALRKVILTRVAAYNERTFSRPYQQNIARWLTMAGNPSEIIAPEFIGLQEVSLVAFTLMGAFFWLTVDMPLLYAAGFLVLGWYYPWIWLRDQAKKRHHKITRALPYNLDLLTLSVEAGLDFSQAVGKVVEKGRKGPLVDEFSLMLKNIKLGKTREEALKLMAERVGLASLTSFCNALIQADRMGTSLGKILRIQSTQLRVERTHRAEKLANEAPVKMLFPLIACIFPTVFMVLFGPIIFQAITGGGE
jgi:tight adherence protein C